MSPQNYISPFRYPGGKSWFVKPFRRWLGERAVKTVIEPFAGGASVSLSSLEAGDCERVILVESDPRVAAVWKTILGAQSGKLVERIRGFRPTRAAVENALGQEPKSEFEMAWQTLLRNRVSHGGITAPGSGVLKRGENGQGVGSRWYPETLAGRIDRIHRLSRRIRFIEGDAVTYLSNVTANGPWRRTVFFIDPPYPRAGRRLYAHSDIDHEKLLSILSTLPHPFLVTYEHAARILKLATRHGLHCRTIGMRTRTNRHRRELLISNEPFYK